MKRIILVLLCLILSSFLNLYSEEVVKEQAKKVVLIGVDPGFTWFAYRTAEKIQNTLKLENFDVKFTETQYFITNNLELFSAVIICGPVYAGRPSGDVQKMMQYVPDAFDKPILIFLTGGADFSQAEAFVKDTAARRKINLVSINGFFVQNESKKNVFDKTVADFLKPLMDQP